MQIHDIFEIAYSVKLVGLSNESQLVRTFFMRSGKRLAFSKIIELYEEILNVVKSFGYSDVFDFLNDYFPNENFEKIRIYRKNLNVKLAINNPLQSSPVESIISSPLPRPFQPELEEPKSIPAQIEKHEVVNKEVSVKPIKIFKDALKDYKSKEKITKRISLPFNKDKSTINDNLNIQSKESSLINDNTLDKQLKDSTINNNTVDMEIPRENNSEYEITPKDKIRINKYKKLSRKFREMDAREKEIDNKYDYFMHRSKVNQNPQIIVDNRTILEENPFVGKFYDDLDLEFRMVMYKIYRFNKSKVKDKSHYNEEIEFLEKYFYKKLQIARKDDDSVKKLTNAIAYLMKKLQNKIFETEDPKVIESMLYFKTKLYLFYNYYRK